MIYRQAKIIDAAAILLLNQKFYQAFIDGDKDKGFLKNEFSLKEIEERLQVAGHKVSGLFDVKAGAVNSRGRLKQVALQASKGGVSISGEQFRKAVGYGVIKSTRFTLKSSKNEISFSGSGNGHGVGLCQWGAKQRALDGFECREILSYYYPGTELKKLSDIR